VGTGLRELRSLELWWADGQPLSVSELHFASAVRERTPLRGRVVTVSNACSASSFTLGLAEDMLELGRADAVVVAGCDSITESMFGLADRTNGLHPQELQPFDNDRRGVVLGEGAAAVVLERAATAAARGARARARLAGVGLSCDAHHETAPHVEGLAAAMRDAYRRSEISPDEVDLVMAHGTGTALNDPAELRAMRSVLGARAEAVLVTGLKSMTGHTSGASGLMSLITAVEAMRQGRVPPTVGLRRPIPEASGLDLVVDEARSASIRVAQVNAFGFGGVNAVALLEAA
jgi:3-oxoacyl-[acyl-carrier-protein] synthase II